MTYGYWSKYQKAAHGSGNVPKRPCGKSAGDSVNALPDRAGDENTDDGSGKRDSGRTGVQDGKPDRVMIGKGKYDIK